MSFLALSKELLPVSWSQLHICAYQGEVSTLERLLVIPADSSNVDLEDAHGRTALCIALQNRRTEAALLLVENGASLEKALSSKGDLVTSSIPYECGVQLLKRERTRMKLQPFPAFLTAVACNSSMEGDLHLLEAAVSVLESSAKKQDCIGLYPVHYAVMGGHIDCLETLLSHGADPDTVSPMNKSTPLHLACRSGHSAIVALLLDSIRFENEITTALLGRSVDGYTPLELALMHQQRSVVDLLLQDIRENAVHENWAKLLYLAVSWADVGLLQQLSAVFPSNWADELPNTNPPSPAMTSSRTIRYQRKQKRGKPFTTALPDLPYYPVHLAATLGNISTVQFILSQSSERKRLLQWKDASGRTVASLLGQLVSSDASLEHEVMEVMRSELQLPNEMSFEWAVLHHMITTYCRSDNSHYRYSQLSKSPLQDWPEWYTKIRLQEFYRAFGIFRSVDLRNEQEQIIVARKILTRFKVPLNEDMSSFFSLMWTAVVGGASIAMVSLLMNHGGSPFISSNSASSLKYLCPKSRIPALGVAMVFGHISIAETIIQMDQPSFPTDEETVSVIVSLLHVVVSHDHYRCVSQLLIKQKSYLNALLLSRHGPRLLFLSLCNEDGIELAQLLINGYIRLVSLQLLEDSESCTKELLSLCLSATNRVLSTSPYVHLTTLLRPLALLLNLCVQHYYSELFCCLCGWGYSDLVQLLLDHNLKLACLVDEHQRSPLYYAAVGGQLDVVKLLLANGGLSQVEGTRAVLENGIVQSPPPILGMLVYLAINCPKNRHLHTFSPLKHNFLYKDRIPNCFLQSELVPSNGVSFSNVYQNSEQAKELVDVLTSAKVNLDLASLYLAIMSLIYDLDIVEPLIDACLEHHTETLDSSTLVPIDADFILSIVPPASLHPSPELFEQILASIVATTSLCNPAVAAQKEYWNIVSVVFPLNNGEPALPSAEQESMSMFLLSCVFVLSLAIKANREAIALAVCQVMSGLEEGIERIVWHSNALILLCCKHNCLSVLQKLMVIDQIEAKLSDAVNASIKFGNIEVLEWVWSFKPDVFHCSYKSCLLLAGSRGRLDAVQWLHTIMDQLPASTGIDSNMLFWSTVLEGSSRGGHEEMSLHALGQMSLSEILQLAQCPTYHQTICWCCSWGLVPVLEALHISDNQLFVKPVYNGVSPVDCAIANGKMHTLLTLDVFPKLTTNNSPAKYSSLSGLTWNRNWSTESFSINCLSIGWFRFVVGPAESVCDKHILTLDRQLVPVRDLDRLPPMLNEFRRAVAVGNDTMVQGFLNAWGHNAGYILYHIQTKFDAGILQLACYSPTVLEMLLQQLFSVGLAAEIITFSVLEASISSNNLKSIHLLLNVGPSNLILLQDSLTKRNVLHVATEKGVCLPVFKCLVSQLGDHLSEYLASKDSHNISPSLIVANPDNYIARVQN